MRKWKNYRDLKVLEKFIVLMLVSSVPDDENIER